MSATLFFLLLAFLLLATFGYIAKRRRGPLPDLDAALLTIRSLDIEAFRNLLDENEELYLEAHLQRGQFRRIKRERAIAALAYLRVLSDAGLQFARFGSTAQQSEDPEVAASGRQIANSAIQLRLRAIEAGMHLIFAAAFPRHKSRSLSALTEQYDRATHLLIRHTTLMRTTSQAA